MLTRSSPSTKRVLERLEELYALGGGRGANRPAGGEAEARACDLVASWMSDAGLEVERDPFGNVIGRGGDVWTGSHVDSVPEGGKFDGALGVVAGIEAAAAVGCTVVAFRDEERGCFGSQALATSGRLPRRYIELHIEQGPVLERAGAPLGVVTGIVGSTRREVVFEGAAGHAGTTPMDVREDALVQAAEFVLRVRDAARGIEGAVATVGQIDVEPGAVNVIPGRVRLSVDARAPDRDRLARLLDVIGLDHGVDLEPVSLDEGIREVLRDEIDRAGLPVVEVPSGAGHDAGVLAAAGVETGMLFVRSLNGGVSHSPDELSSEDDIALALDVLTGALRRLAQ